MTQEELTRLIRTLHMPQVKPVSLTVEVLEALVRQTWNGLNVGCISDLANVIFNTQDVWAQTLARYLLDKHSWTYADHQYHHHADKLVDDVLSHR